MDIDRESPPMNMSDSVFIARLSAVLGLGLNGCQSEGIAEKAGQKIDPAAENADNTKDAK